MTPAALEQAAVRYLQRFASSEKNLERVLLRKLRRLGPVGDDDRAHIAEVVDTMKRAGLIDDNAYARGVVQSAVSSGKSLFAARQKLRQKGVPGPIIDAAIAVRTDDDELLSAHRYARRRRLGPYRRTAPAGAGQPDAGRLDADERRKDLAKLCRRGFSFGLAARVIDADPEDRIGEWA